MKAIAKFLSHNIRYKYKVYWLQRVDLNHRPSGYEPDELPLLYSAIQEVRINFEISFASGWGRRIRTSE